VEIKARIDATEIDMKIAAATAAIEDDNEVEILENEIRCPILGRFR